MAQASISQRKEEFVLKSKPTIADLLFILISIASLILSFTLINYAVNLTLPSSPYLNMSALFQAEEWHQWADAYDRACFAAGGTSEAGGYPCTAPFDKTTLPHYIVPEDNPAYTNARTLQLVLMLVGCMLLVTACVTSLELARRFLRHHKTQMTSS